MATEVLSEYLERDINSEDAQDIKQKVQDKYRYDLTPVCFLSFNRIFSLNLTNRNFFKIPT